MNPREIEVHIEELVLHGFDPAARWSVGDAVQLELSRLLQAHGLPEGWRENGAGFKVETNPAIRLTNSKTTGREIARAFYRGEAAS